MNGFFKIDYELKWIFQELHTKLNSPPEILLLVENFS